MSVFFTRPRAEKRSSWAEWAAGGSLFGARTKSGVAVSNDSAQRVSAFWSTTHLLASIISNLPVDVSRGKGASKVAVEPLPPFIAAPSLLVSRREWVYQAMMSLLPAGNAFGISVSKDSLGRTTKAEWFDPSSVTVRQEHQLDRPTYLVDGSVVPPGEIIHLRAFVKPGSVVGRSVVEYQAETLGVAIAGRDYGSSFYGGGGHPTAVFANSKQTFSPDEAGEMKRRYKAMVNGSREPLVVGSDWTYTPIQATMAEAALVETMGYTDAMIARLFGPGLAEILGFTQSGSSLTYTNRIDRSLDVLQFTALYWVNLFEDFLTSQIAAPQTARFNVGALLRMDPKTQHETFKLDREMGLRSIDEIRDLIDLSPLPDGIGQDYTPLKSAPAGGSNGD